MHLYLLVLPMELFQQSPLPLPSSHPTHDVRLSSPLNDYQLLTPLPFGVPNSSLPLFNLSHLVIHGPKSHLLDWKAFLARCTCLTTFEIFGGNDLTIYSSILEAVPVPTSVTSLSLWIQDSPAEADPRTFTAIRVSLLPNLKKLTFGGEGDYSQTLLDARRNSQLEHITIDFEDGANVSFSILSDFISFLPPDCSLRHLDFDVWTGRKGRRAVEVNIEQIMSEPLARIVVDWAERCALDGWMLPEIPDCLDGAGLSSMRENAVAKGVDIGGSIVTALMLQEEYRKEAREFGRMWDAWKEVNPE